MKLLYQTHSPYARKALVFAHEVGLAARLQVVHQETSPTVLEPTTWSLVRARLWREKPALPAHPGAQIYVVGYLATASK